MYSREELLGLRDAAGAYAFSRPEELSLLFCRDEPGSIFAAPPPGTASYLANRDADNKTGRNRTANPMRSGQQPLRADKDPRGMERDKRFGMGGPRTGVTNGTNNWDPNYSSKPSGSRDRRYGFGYDRDEETFGEKADFGSDPLILSPSRKLFPSSQIQSQQSNAPRRTGNVGNGVQPPPGLRDNSRYVPPHASDRPNLAHAERNNVTRRQGFPGKEDGPNSKTKYQLKKQNDGNADNVSNLVGKDFVNIDSLFAVDNENEGKTFSWDDFVKYAVPETEEEPSEDDEQVSSRGLGRWFSSKNLQENEDITDIQEETTDQQRQGIAPKSEIDLLPLLNQNTAANQNQLNDSTNHLKALLPQLTSQPVDPVKESESASFITSLLSKSSLQGNIQPGSQNPMYHPHLPMPFGVPQPLHQGNFYPPPMGFYPPGAMKPGQFQSQDMQFSGYPPNQMAPHNGQPLPHGVPHPFPVQNMPMMVPSNPGFNNSPAPQQEQTGLEKWFGAAIYQATPPSHLPPPSNAKMVSLEEIERKVVQVPYPSGPPSSATPPAPIPFQANSNVGILHPQQQQQRIK